MRYIFLGLIVGFILNFFVFTLSSGSELEAKWYKSLDSEFTKKTDKSKDKNYFSVKMEHSLLTYDSNGNDISKLEDSKDIFSVSGNGRFAIKFNKVGSSVEFLNTYGEPFLKMDSREYPHLSYNGKLILLINGDLSRIRLSNFNGNIIGEKEISGRLCTSYCFSKKSDLAGVGFLDGTFYFVNEFGEIIYSNSVKNGNIVKGLAISNNGKFGVVHSGNSDKDYVRVINIVEKSSNSIYVGLSKKVKTAIFVDNSGETLFLENDSILNINDSSKLNYKMNISPVRKGYALINAIGNFYVATYPLQSGGTKFLIFKKSGKIYFSKKFKDEKFMDFYILKNKIILRGIDTLFCYKFHH